jgi:hypothetical protein
VAGALLADAPIGVVGLAAAVVSVAITLTRPTHHALLPQISRTTGDLTVGNAASGSLEAIAAFLGALAGGLLLAAWGAGGVLVAMSGTVGVAALRQTGLPVIAMVFVAVSGAGKLFYDVTSRTFTQRLLPDHLLTPTFGLQESFAMIGIALGTLAAPFLVDSVGARAAFVVAGCFLPLTALVSYRSLRRLDAGSAVPLDVLALLERVPILAVLPARILERLARDATEQEAPAGADIVRQGDAGARLYVIASGRARVDIDGTEIRELGPGDWFGEIALLRDVPRTASVTALTAVTLRGLDRESFLPSVAATSSAVEMADSYGRDHYA